MVPSNQFLSAVIAIAHSTLALVKDLGVIYGLMLTKGDRLFRSIAGDFGVIHGITLAGFLVLCLRNNSTPGATDFWFRRGVSDGH